MATGRWVMARLGRLLLAGSVISAGWLLLDAPSAGATASVVETTATANINGRTGLATLQLILNESAASTGKVHLFGILSDGTKVALGGSVTHTESVTHIKTKPCASASGRPVTLGTSASVELQNCGPTLVTLTFAVTDPTISSGTLQVVARDGTTSNIALTITRTPPAWSVTLVLGVAGLLGLLTIFWAGAQVTRSKLRAYLLDPNWPNPPPPVDPPAPIDGSGDGVAAPSEPSSLWKRWKEPLAEAASWTFDSWGTNLSVLGAAAGATFGASGSLTSVFPGVSSTTFVVLSIVFGVLVAAAPLLFNTITTADSANVEGHKTTVGTVGGFMVSGSLTAAAALGEIGTFGLLVIMGGISGVRLVGVGAVLGVSSLLTLWYLFVTMKSGTTHGRSYRKPTTSGKRLATENAEATRAAAAAAAEAALAAAAAEVTPAPAVEGAAPAASADKPSRAGVRVALL